MPCEHRGWCWRRWKSACFLFSVACPFLRNPFTGVFYIFWVQSWDSKHLKMYRHMSKYSDCWRKITIRKSLTFQFSGSEIGSYIAPLKPSLYKEYLNDAQLTGFMIKASDSPCTTLQLFSFCKIETWNQKHLLKDFQQPQNNRIFVCFRSCYTTFFNLFPFASGIQLSEEWPTLIAIFALFLIIAIMLPQSLA